jgi:hypothetical protein
LPTIGKKIGSRITIHDLDDHQYHPCSSFTIGSLLHKKDETVRDHSMFKHYNEEVGHLETSVIVRSKYGKASFFFVSFTLWVTWARLGKLFTLQTIFKNTNVVLCVVSKDPINLF